VAFEITDWNNELSPWNAPPVFGAEPFGNGASETLNYLENALIPELTSRFGSDLPIILGGYSLAGLFSLWAVYTSERFNAVAAVSPSVWFPGWLDFIDSRFPYAQNIYLSLGKKEEKTRNRTMAAVGDNIRRQYEILNKSGVNCILEWNEGNHFAEPEIRTAKGFAWCINNI
jgi:predicted alpha/beta superfamily hydrolase